MSKKKIYTALFFVLFISIRLLAQTGCDPAWDPNCQSDPVNVPIPGILYFLAALLGVGLKKIYNARKKS